MLGDGGVAGGVRTCNRPSWLQLIHWGRRRLRHLRQLPRGRHQPHATQDDLLAPPQPRRRVRGTVDPRVDDRAGQQRGFLGRQRRWPACRSTCATRPPPRRFRRPTRSRSGKSRGCAVSSAPPRAGARSAARRLRARVSPAFYADPRYERRHLESYEQVTRRATRKDAKLQFFLNQRASLNKATPLQALARGQVAAVKSAAEGLRRVETADCWNSTSSRPVRNRRRVDEVRATLGADYISLHCITSAATRRSKRI